MDPAAYGTWNPELASLEAEQAKLQNELKKKPPVVFAILAGVGFLLAVSFLRISLETYASPGDEALIARTEEVLRELLYQVLENDFDPWGALYNGGDLTKPERSPVHVWWAEAEAVSAMLCGYSLTGDEHFLTACEKQVSIIDKYFVNREHGDWYNNILVDEEGGRVVDGMHGFDKLNSGKCPFHNSQMCMEVIARVEKILNG
jgi:hypothetical protein